MKGRDMKIGLLRKANGGGESLAVSFPYNPAMVARIKTFEGRRWDGTNKRWELPMNHLDRLKQMFPDADFSEGITNYLENKRLMLENARKEFNELIRGIDLTKPLPNGMTLFNHQREGVLSMLRYRRAILADDMGLGKTLQSLVAAKILSQAYGWQIIIIAPASLLEKPWSRDARSLGISQMMYSVYSWAKIPSAPIKDFILIADEAHYAANGKKTIRGKAFLELALSEHCRACIPATGTPMKNGRPINIFPLLQAVRSEVAKDSRYFQQKFCDAHLTTIKRKKGKSITFWDMSGASNLTELSRILKNVIIRRTKKDCLDLPEKLRVLRQAELSPESILVYKDTLRKSRERYQERLAKGEIKNEGEALVELLNLAKAGAIGKVETAHELAEEVIEEGNQVVIFSTFTEPLKMLKSKFEKAGIASELLIGDTKNREELVDRFLKKESKVFLLSMAGGVGIDLYTANTIILINRPWAPGDVLQIEDRTHRIGQKNPVTSIWLQYGEVDEHVDEILDSKSININEVFQEKNTGSILAFAKKYLKKK